MNKKSWFKFIEDLSERVDELELKRLVFIKKQFNEIEKRQKKLKK